MFVTGPIDQTAIGRGACVCKAGETARAPVNERGDFARLLDRKDTGMSGNRAALSAAPPSNQHSGAGLAATAFADVDFFQAAIAWQSVAPSAPLQNAVAARNDPSAAHAPNGTALVNVTRPSRLLAWQKSIAGSPLQEYVAAVPAATNTVTGPACPAPMFGDGTQTDPNPIVQLHCSAASRRSAACRTPSIAAFTLSQTDSGISVTIGVPGLTMKAAEQLDRRLRRELAAAQPPVQAIKINGRIARPGTED